MNKVLYITENILYGLQIGKLILLKKNELLLFFNLTMDINKYTMIIMYIVIFIVFVYMVIV